MNDNLIHPMLAHLVLVVALYSLLSLVRAASVWNVGAREDGSNPWENIEPRVSANLSNQFEWPLFFYVVCMVAMFQGVFASSILVWLAWAFVAGRFIHSAVHILTTSIRLRGLAFTINFLAVLGMWFYIAFPNAIK